MAGLGSGLGVLVSYYQPPRALGQGVVASDGEVDAVGHGRGVQVDHDVTTLGILHAVASVGVGDMVLDNSDRFWQNSVDSSQVI